MELDVTVQNRANSIAVFPIKFPLPLIVNFASAENSTAYCIRGVVKAWPLPNALFELGTAMGLNGGASARQCGKCQ